MGSVAAITSAAALAIWGFSLADPIASVVIGVLILVGSWPLLHDTVRILLQSALPNVDVEAARSLLIQQPERWLLMTSMFGRWTLGWRLPSAVLIIERDELSGY